MNYEEALFYKLMLQAGITDTFTAALEHLLETEDPLSDIALELSLCGSDINKTISCLHEFTLDKPIDQNAVFDRIWADLRYRYFNDKLTKEEVISVMYSAAVNSEKCTDDPWYTMYIMYDCFCSSEEGYLDKVAFDAAFERFLTDKTPTARSAEPKLPRMKDIIQREKSNMNRIRFIVNYRIVPVYAVLCVLILTAFGILMSIDEARYLPLGIGLLGAFGFITAALLISVPFIRKKEIFIEMDRYNFSSPAVPKNEYDFSTEAQSVRFDSYGMYIDNKLFWYNHMEIMVVTSNRLNRIRIVLRFMTNPGNGYELPLNSETIAMIRSLNIPLKNPEVLEYILKNKKQAFTQIYGFGKVRVPENGKKALK